ncbi:hypothetical protein TUN199_09670 [Pyrenophora tritici-repentis]|uniref:Uncharacterized protein n=1 Tax=Pyrenophora tritici-repentis TaxID=45151 RepID=A0A5M9KYV6_9PLEO|nr:hypothetical protein PtrV1_09508 [Pyrenophora tritici-repentis]KAF7568493.1 hypothetical protein PtrM4_131060 [Pyrenophora tritici-repentis]KAI0569396.1 hypothetical protein Alg215_11662 [Pyrenophora tritici-repentis]KAI0569769.1 hypothetical protein Alg130_11508 [Pyrenophora tritici-repentis]KAI0606183.1 hypothetical protein TUN205_09562 [Pyrenophora tritici-repentis]
MIFTSASQATSYLSATDISCIDFPTVLTAETAHNAWIRFQSAYMGGHIMAPRLTILMRGDFTVTRLLIWVDYVFVGFSHS